MNTNITYSIYWVNKFLRIIATLIYISHKTISKSWYSNPSMSRNRDYRFLQKTETRSAHFLQVTPVPLLPMLAIMETVSLFIQPVAEAAGLMASITAGHLLTHVTGGATLALRSISTTTALLHILS